MVLPIQGKNQVVAALDYSQCRTARESTPAARPNFGNMIHASFPAWLRIRGRQPQLMVGGRPRFGALVYASVASCAVCALSAPTATQAADPDVYLAYDGEARSSDATTILYREHHVLRSRDGVLAERAVT